MSAYAHITHGFEPVFDEGSRVLVLGSLPSVASRENAFYYGHPRNRFWAVMAACLGAGVPPTPPDVSLEESIGAKRRMLIRGGVALWDVIASCDIQGSSDASIRDVVPNDIGRILGAAPIRAVFCNGGTAQRLYARLIQPSVGVASIGLPSTSPANAGWSLARLTDEWVRQLGPYLG